MNQLRSPDKAQRNPGMDQPSRIPPLRGYIRATAGLRFDRSNYEHAP